MFAENVQDYQDSIDMHLFYILCRTIMTVPTIDSISWDNFRYYSTYSKNLHFRGIFEWGFLYKEHLVPQKVLDMRQHNSEPYWYEFK